MPRAQSALAMTLLLQEVRYKPGTGRPGGRPLRTAIGRHSVGDDAHIVPVAPASLLCVGRGGPVAVPKISALPYGGRLKF